MKLIILALVAAVAFAGTGVPVVTICSAPNSILKNLQYSITPNDIQPGSNLNVTISGTLTETVQTSTATLTASFDGIPILTKTLNLCDKLTCPIAAGPFTYTVSHSIPNLPVSGTVNAKANIVANGATPVACVDVSVSI